jgi:hypothetical protein
MLALLATLTCIVVLLPMLPALFEWRRPRDVTPLHIDGEDALDPPCLAQAFGRQLAAALAAGDATLGAAVIARGPAAGGAWPLEAGERTARRTRRLWFVEGDAELPAAIDFLAEVAASHNLRSAADAHYGALLARGELMLAPGCTVQRWAHAERVEVQAGSRLDGRVSAEQALLLHGPAAFVLLHAPVIRFGDAPAGGASATDAPDGVFPLGLTDGVTWDASGERALAQAALDVGSHRAWRGDLVVRGDVRLGTGCNAHGSVKAHGGLLLGAGSSASGSLIAEGEIRLAAGCTVRGSVVSETLVVLGPGCVIGAPGRPATVAAPRIEAAAGVVVHGTVWAGEHGGVVAATLPAAVLRSTPAEPAAARGAAA